MGEDDLIGKIKDLEARLRHVETRHAVFEESRHHMDQKFAELKTFVQSEVQSVKSIISKVAWTLVMAIVMPLLGAIITFALSGGFHAP